MLWLAGPGRSPVWSHDWTDAIELATAKPLGRHPLANAMFRAVMPLTFEAFAL